MPMTRIANKQSTGPPEHLLGCLRGASLFSNLSDKELACFNDAAHARSYKKGKVLYLEEENAESFYVICGGWIKLFHTLPEGEEVIAEVEDRAVRDAGILAAAQAAEHYEIARYGTLCAWAKALGHEDAVELLQETLDEEKHADEVLKEIAESAVNEAAVEEVQDEAAE